MSLVMQPLVLKEEVKQETLIDQPTPVKIPIPVDAQLVSQAMSIAQTLSAAAATSTSSSTQSNTSQQASSVSISNQQPTISAPTGSAPSNKSNLVSSSLSTTPTLKSQKSFNPTESFLSNFNTPPINPTSGNNNSIGSTSTIRMGSNSIGSGSIFSSLTAPFKSSLNTSSQPIIAPSSNTSTSSINQASTLGESADVVNFTNHIFSQPYLFYQSNNMNIPQLEASQDDLYTVFTFIVPNKPYANNSTNSQLQKNNSSSNSSNNNNNNPSSSSSTSSGTNNGGSSSSGGNMSQMSMIGNNAKLNGPYTSYNSSNTLSSLSSNSNTPVIQNSSLLNASSMGNSSSTTINSNTPNGFQKSGDNQLTKSHRNSFSSTSTTPKIPHFGLSGQSKEERKSSLKGQSLVDIIKQQCNPEDEKRKKSDSIPTFNNLGSGFKSNFNSSSNLGSLTQLPMGGLSQSSITSLLNLSLNPMNNNNNGNNNVSGFNPINSTNFGLNNSNQNNTDAMESEEALMFLQQIKQEQQMLIKQELQNQESQSQLNAMNDEEEEKVVMPDSNDEEDDECDEEGDDDDKKSGNESNDEDEEARLIREIKEMKKKKATGQSMFTKNFKKDGGFLFGGEGQDGDIFDFCEEKLGGGSKKQKKNGSGGHKNKFDTKNLVKNFLNSFISFAHHPDEEAAIIDVLGFESSPQLNDFRSNLRNFFKGKKFNRVLLKEFIFEDLFRPLFLFFLENRALNWIESGRMKDKASHLRALKNFIFVCQHYDQIKSWRFRYNFVQN